MNTVISPDQKQYHFVFMLSAQGVEITSDHQIIFTQIDPKVLYMTARPGRSRAFLTADQFVTTWIKNKSVFTKQPPQVAIIYSEMKTDVNDTAKAIPIEISDPSLSDNKNLIFKNVKCNSDSLQIGKYRDIVLFIDWLPSSECPQPIQLELPGLFSKK